MDDTANDSLCVSVCTVYNK